MRLICAKGAGGSFFVPCLEKNGGINMGLAELFILAVGITLAFLKVNIWAAASFIGVMTFIISAAGVKIGHVFGEKYTNKAELAGGLILMGIGVKILLEHLGVINF